MLTSLEQASQGSISAPPTPTSSIFSVGKFHNIAATMRFDQGLCQLADITRAGPTSSLSSITVGQELATTTAIDTATISSTVV